MAERREGTIDSTSPEVAQLLSSFSGFSASSREMGGKKPTA